MTTLLVACVSCDRYGLNMGRTGNRSRADLRIELRTDGKRDGLRFARAFRYGCAAWLAASLGAGCAAQSEDDDTPQGGKSGSSHAGGGQGGTSGTGGASAGGGSGGLSLGGSAGSSGGKGGSAGESGESTGGSAGASGGKGGAGAGGSAGSGGGSGGKGGSGGTGGSGGSGGSGGAGGKGGSGGTGGSGGASGSGGSGGMPVDTCKNTMMDGTETDVDCGGTCTTQCATDKGCKVVGDCVAANVCDADKCRANGCNATNCAYALTRYVVGASSAKGQVFVTWSATALQVDFQISDATPANDSDLNWEDDSVEVYLDLNKGKTATYQADDFQITVPRAAGALSGVGAFTEGSITIVRTEVTGGYRVQATIPWSALNGAASPVGTTIGFDIGVNDDNGSGTRDGQIILYGGINNYQDTSQFGELVLTQ